MIDFPKSTQQQSYFQGHVAREKCVKPPRCENWRRERLRDFITYMVIYLSYVDSFLDSRVHVPVRVSINKLNFIPKRAVASWRA